jgi:hypothetical protein
MKSIAEMSSLELAAYVCDTLKQRGILTTLSGGFCTEIYSCGAYTSMDIDLINQYNEDHKKIVSIMLELGFKQDGRYFYHDDALYAIEFPSGPPAVGDELIKDIAEIDTEAGVLRILTPTDAIKDRLAAYYFWNSDRTLEQALWIAEKNPFDMQNIENWSHTEGMDQKFATFKAKYFEIMSEVGKLD